MAKKTVKRTRRTPAQVDQAVKMIKEAVANGMTVGKACKKFKMAPSQYQNMKNRAFPEITKTKSGKVINGGLKQFTRQQILDALNAPVAEIEAQIKALELQIERVLDARDATIKALGL